MVGTSRNDYPIPSPCPSCWRNEVFPHEIGQAGLDRYILVLGDASQGVFDCRIAPDLFWNWVLLLCCIRSSLCNLDGAWLEFSRLLPIALQWCDPHRRWIGRRLCRTYLRRDQAEAALCARRFGQYSSVGMCKSRSVDQSARLFGRSEFTPLSRTSSSSR